jgi:hypothetical protein
MLYNRLLLLLWLHRRLVFKVKILLSPAPVPSFFWYAVWSTIDKAGTDDYGFGIPVLLL